MFVFWVLQTACFGVYSTTGNLAAGHTFIAMICKFLLKFSGYQALTFCCEKSCSMAAVSVVDPAVFCDVLTKCSSRFIDDVSTMGSTKRTVHNY